MRPHPGDYYEARGFSVYYLANTVFNLVSHPGNYLRGIEDVLGDMHVLNLMRPFSRYTNLHYFVREICSEIVVEEVYTDDEDRRYITAFLDIYRVPYEIGDLEDIETFWDSAGGTERFQDALDELTEEVFHVLFNDLIFLQRFNRLCAGYIEIAGFDDGNRTASGTLKRVRIPTWARRAVFHRDHGECRNCKKSLAQIISRLDVEHYDHIVPLALYGANDVTNLQLLCDACNLAKSASPDNVSNFVQRSFRV